MGKPVKYFLIGIAAVSVLITGAIALIPQFVDVEDFKPQVEALVAKRTGYPLHLEGEVSLSLFPWIGLSFSDLRLDNPDSFSDSAFISIKNFQAQLKFLPLFSRNVEIRKFVIEKPEIHLIKNDKGIWNWQKPAPKQRPQEPAGNSQEPDLESESTADKSPDAGFILQSLIVGECTISNGTVIIEDKMAGLKKTFSDLSIKLTDVSFDKPINLFIEAQLEGKPLDIQGSVGPLGREPGKGKIAFQAKMNTFDTMTLSASGELTDLQTSPHYSLHIKVDPFNPKELFSRFGADFPLSTSDPDALKRFGFTGNISGTTTTLDISKSTITLDDSSIGVALNVQSFAGPGLTFEGTIDSINLDRYLPAKELNQTDTPTTSIPESPPPEVAGGAVVKTSESPDKTSKSNEQTKTARTPLPSELPHDKIDSPQRDYSALRNLDLNGTVEIGTLTVRNITTTDLSITFSGNKGLFQLTSLEGALYGGTFESTGSLDVQKDTAVSDLNVTLKGTQAGPLLKDLTQKNLLEGTIDASASITMHGDTPESIMKTLNGAGDTVVRDGALIGIDLAQLARTITSGFSLDQQGERPKTDFAEFHAPFTITDGLLTTKETTLRSPFIRVKAHGNANLVSQEIDLSVIPKIVGTIKGQGDDESHSGISVPIVVGGTFKAPTFAPDLEALVKEQAIDEEEIKEILKTGEITPERKEQLSEEVEKAKNLFKGLFGN